MILKIINVFPPSIRGNLSDKKLVDLFDKLEQDPEECSKATALELVKTMGDDYKSQIEKLHSTDLNFLYVVKDENKGYYYIYTPRCDMYYIDIIIVKYIVDINILQDVICIILISTIYLTMMILLLKNLGIFSA